MTRLRFIALALCLGLPFGCDSGNPNGGGADMAGPGGDGGTSGGGDGGFSGQPGLTILAGQPGGGGYADRVGSLARFQDPTGLAFDLPGTLYITEPTQSTPIRKLDVSTGAVSTISGAPTGVTVMVSDGAGTIYYAGISTVGKYVPATGMKTSLAGGGFGSSDGTGSAAGFGYIRGMAWDGAGTLYIADQGNQLIRKLVVATGVVTTIAGTPTSMVIADGTGPAAHFVDPEAMAVDPVAGNLYIAEKQQSVLRKLVLSTNAVTTIAGVANMSGAIDGVGTAARLNQPQSMVYDGNGHLFMVEYLGNRIRQVDTATVTVSTLAGGTLGRSLDGIGTAAVFNNPTQLVWDGAGNLYVSDTSGHCIRKVVVATAAVTTVAGSEAHPGAQNGIGMAATFASPGRIVADGAGNVYVAGYFIRKVVVATGEVSTYAGGGGAFDGVGTAAKFNSPSSLAVDGRGNMYVADASDQTIRKIDLATATVTTLAGSHGMMGSVDGTGAAARFNNPGGVAADKNGNVYVADTNNFTIRKIDAATGVVTTLAGAVGMGGSVNGIGAAARFNAPTNIAADDSGNLYVTETATNTVRKIIAATGEAMSFAGAAGSGTMDGVGTAARFKNPWAMAFDGAGSLYVADSGNGLIRRIDLVTVTVSAVLGVTGQRGVLPGPLPGGLNSINGVAVAPGQGVVVSDSAENVLLLGRGF